MLISLVLKNDVGLSWSHQLSQILVLKGSHFVLNFEHFLEVSSLESSCTILEHCEKLTIPKTKLDDWMKSCSIILSLVLAGLHYRTM